MLGRLPQCDPNSPEAKAALTIRHNPRARVSLSPARGRRVRGLGATLFLGLTPGTYHYRVSLEEHLPKSGQVVLAACDDRVLEAMLDPQASKPPALPLGGNALLVVAHNPGASVTLSPALGTRIVGEQHTLFVGLPPGSYTYLVTLPEYQGLSGTLSLVAGQNALLTVELQPIGGSITGIAALTLLPELLQGFGVYSPGGGNIAGSAQLLAQVQSLLGVGNVNPPAGSYVGTMAVQTAKQTLAALGSSSGPSAISGSAALSLKSQILAGSGSYAPPAGSTQTLNFSEDTSNFLNPERGVRDGFQMGYGNNNSYTNPANITDTTLAGWNPANIRAAGTTVAQAYVSLRPHKNSAIPQSYLDTLASRLAACRTAGIKVVLRFWYGWTYSESVGHEPDAPKSRILSHITQLTPLFQDYADVILVLQAGFIGLWGEWYYSTNFGTPPGAADKADVMNALLSAVPSSRFVQCTIVSDLQSLTNLSEGTAYNGSNGSRIGFHNDAFVANQADAGTFPWDDPDRTTKREWVAARTKWMPVGGEMAGDIPVPTEPDPYNRRNASGLLAEFAKFNWSWIARDFGQPDIGPQQWASMGIDQTIGKKLGYRYRLTQVTMPTSLTPGTGFTMNLKLTNDGWASAFNPRPVRVVLRRQSDQTLFVINTNLDPRRWYAGVNQDLNLTLTAPSGLTSGSYDVLLWFPDGSATLENNPLFAIRLANTGVWESATGMNKIGTLTV